MPAAATEPRALTSIIDNRGENSLQKALEIITENGRELWIATAFFSLDALNMVGENLVRADRIRLLFGDDASARQRNALIRAMQERSDADLLKQREADPLLNGLRLAKQLIDEGRLEARVYTREKFHAKLYISHRKGFLAESLCLVERHPLRRPASRRFLHRNAIPQLFTHDLPITEPIDDCHKDLPASGGDLCAL
jgi:hypothetical protein